MVAWLCQGLCCDKHNTMSIPMIYKKIFMVLLVCSRYASVWWIVSENVFYIHHLRKALVLSHLGTESLLIAYKLQTYQFCFLFLWRLHPPSLLLSPLLISLRLPLCMPPSSFPSCLRCCTLLSLSLIISPSLRSNITLHLRSNKLYLYSNFRAANKLISSSWHYVKII